MLNEEDAPGNALEAQQDSIPVLGAERDRLERKVFEGARQQWTPFGEMTIHPSARRATADMAEQSRAPAYSSLINAALHRYVDAQKRRAGH